MFGLQHYQKRRHGSLESGFPTRRSVAKTALDLLIYPAAVASPLALVPQAWALWSSRDAGSLALSTWLVLACVNLMWIAYGRVHRERPIVLTNIASLVLNAAIALGIFLYR